MMDKLAMGDHGVYVWGCVALTFIVVVLIEWRARLHHHRVYRDVEVRIKAVEERL